MISKTITKLLFLLLVILWLFYVQVDAFKNFSPLLYSDNAIYSSLADKFFQGDFNKAVHMWWQPFFPLMGSLVMLLGFSAPQALFYVSLLSGVLLFVPVFYLTKN